LAIAGSIYFIAHNIFAKTNTFFIGGLVNKLQSSFNLRNTGNLLNTNPLLALLFFLPAMALAGLPPLSGFLESSSLYRHPLNLKNIPSPLSHWWLAY
jgi:multicomponent Na+:H+ antiporter subunit D